MDTILLSSTGTFIYHCSYIIQDVCSLSLGHSCQLQCGVVVRVACLCQVMRLDPISFNETAKAEKKADRALAAGLPLRCSHIK